MAITKAIEIRKMERQDKSTVMGMMRGFYDSPAVTYPVPDEVLSQDIEDCIGDCPYIEGYVFQEEDNLAGYAMIAKSYSTEFGGLCIWIEDLYIEAKYRGIGIGTQFFKYIEEAYRGKAVRYRLEVAADNENAIKVYEKNGYEKVGYVEMMKSGK